MTADKSQLSWDFDRLAPTDTDTERRHRSLRQQWIEQQRANGDGHGRRPGGQVSKAQMNRRRAHCRAAARTREWTARSEAG